ncbi:MAG: GNAT family N-acetyltransferase [Pseudomonadales bacterium]|nr:GNAT family N-acetyltransferase [Pseudomonadales bacterium]MCP5356874.1 GNAT family N-acetyltransferase [Pseudomonadales bacterium]
MNTRHTDSSDNPLRNIQLRLGQETDMAWLYQSFKRTMQIYIQRTWGWDELLQSHSFHHHLPARSFTIASISGGDVGAFNLREKPDHLWLEMLLVPPEHQGQGIGRHLLEHAQHMALQANKPLRLSVLKLNPAQEFYRHLGFAPAEEDRWSMRMQWHPALGEAP